MFNEGKNWRLYSLLINLHLAKVKKIIYRFFFRDYFNKRRVNF